MCVCGGSFKSSDLQTHSETISSFDKLRLSTTEGGLSVTDMRDNMELWSQTTLEAEAVALYQQWVDQHTFVPGELKGDISGWKLTPKQLWVLISQSRKGFPMP